jgi:hypothetical protein
MLKGTESITWGFRSGFQEMYVPGLGCDFEAYLPFGRGDKGKM